MPLYIALQYSAWLLRYRSVSMCIYKCISFILDGKAVLCMWLISVWAFPFGNLMVIYESTIELAKKCILHSVPLPPNKGSPSIIIVVMVTAADICWVLTRTRHGAETLTFIRSSYDLGVQEHRPWNCLELGLSHSSATSCCVTWRHHFLHLYSTVIILVFTLWNCS